MASSDDFDDLQSGGIAGDDDRHLPHPHRSDVSLSIEGDLHGADEAPEAYGVAVFNADSEVSARESIESQSAEGHGITVFDDEASESKEHGEAFFAEPEAIAPAVGFGDAVFDGSAASDPSTMDGVDGPTGAVFLG